MALDRGRLAKIDRRVFAELDHSRGVQMVKVPVSAAAWSTWRRYCETIELSMGYISLVTNPRIAGYCAMTRLRGTCCEVR